MVTALVHGPDPQRIALEGINRGFDDLKAGRSIRSVIVFGDAT
jgi:Zn-dependent alcohol dehydrogenase